MLTLSCETYGSHDRWYLADASQNIISSITPKNKSNDKDCPSVKAVVDYFKFLQIDDDCDGFTSSALFLNYLNCLFPNYV